MTLPTEKQTRAGRDPRSARVLIAGTPKVGKSTLLSGWAPETTLIIDTQGGSNLLEGEHYVQHVESWKAFEQTVQELTLTDHNFLTVGIDLVDDLWNFADEAFAGKNAPLASATDDYQKAVRTAEGIFRQTVGALLRSNMGVWFISHVKETQEAGVTRYKSKLDARVLTYVQGACDFVLLAEALGPKRVLHTAPSAKFEAGSRVPLPEPMDLDARALYAAMNAGLNPPVKKAASKKTEEAVAA